MTPSAEPIPWRAGGKMVLTYPQSGDPTNVMVVIEIPAGSFTKYEIDPLTGALMVHRFQSMPIVYPGNYGSILSSIGGDGEALDVLVLTREPIYPGALVCVRPIGVLKMIDGDLHDDKIIAVPISRIDPNYDDIKSIEDLPSIERHRIEQFFTVYKRLPAGRKEVKLNGFEGANSAIDQVKSALDAFNLRRIAVGALTAHAAKSVEMHAGENSSMVIEVN